MGKNKKPEKQEPRVKITRAQKKQLAALMKKRQAEAGNPFSAQRTIPYQQMTQDGICRVTDTYLSLIHI